ncbi:MULTISPECIES: YheC/YheD family protein [unclassified Paenibacillus]|uniref:YheC/YheD family endospore coat-associated protein n=1 Tax=unclassified Paenibacillus TaxID=185978 RepID=UPI00104EC08A|nr:MULTISPECIES: YheC/YheD family protein [unclassified Paenibacillus]NIK69915.1 glutathione synthase/RimK-type ligase-like ATP-grasp enzyme [Paenibacillus sp. BK720]TCM97749.1 YheC/D-like protein [Paenibacillus sp. BK033]
MRATLVRVGLYVASIEAGAEPENQASGKACGIKLPEPAFAQKLSEAAGRLAIDLYVFSPAEYEEKTGQLTAFRLRDGGWVKEPCPLPDILYDRCFYRTAEERLLCKAVLAAIREQKPVTTLNGSLPGKWEVYGTLRQDSALAPLLPSTIRLNRPDTLLRLLNSYNGELFLKPSAGMQGKGAVHLKLSPSTREWIAAGRTGSNLLFRHRFAHYSSLSRWIRRFTGKASYIAQPYLRLADPNGNPFDLRVLVQKNGKGRWGVTGAAVRAGSTGSVTSNLHGGGTASQPADYLSLLFGEAKAERMMNEITEASLQAAEKLEHNYGRLAELGIDFGIEPDGRIWLLEVNSRPGRSSFQQSGDDEAARLSVELPLRYARLLAQRLNKPLIINDSATGQIQDCQVGRRIRSDNVQEVHP